MSSERLERINSLIARELGQLFARDLELPRSVVLTITCVDTSADLSYARVWVSILPPNAEAATLKLLEAHRGRFQTVFNRKLVMRTVPKLIFRSDQTEERAARIESLLDDLRQNG